MEENRLQTDINEESGDAIVRLVEQQRAAVQDFTSSHRQRLSKIGDELAEQLQKIRAGLAAGQDEVDAARQEERERAEELERIRAELIQRDTELERFRAEAEQVRQSHQQEWDTVRAQHETRTAALDATQSELRCGLEQLEEDRRRLSQDAAALRDQRKQLDDALEELSHDRRRFQEKRERLERDQLDLEELQAKTKSQRRKIARELSEQHARQHREIAERLAESKSLAEADHSRLEEELVAARQTVAQLEEKHAAADAALEDLRQQFESGSSSQTDVEQRIGELEEERNALKQRLETELADKDRALEQRQSELERVQLELSNARQECQRLESIQGEGGADAPSDEFQRRYEMAMDDLRDEKRRNAELEEKLSRANTTTGGDVAVDGNLDWEAQKRRMLAELEEFEDDDEQQAEDRLTIQGTIEITDAVVAEKDAEIAELKQLLDQQSSSIGDVAVGAAAFAEILDNDEIIQQERQQLLQKQAELNEKLKEAEIEISLERAKIARQRAELEDKMLNHLGELAKDREADDADFGKPKRGRWLARLGLSDDEQQ